MLKLKVSGTKNDLIILCYNKDIKRSDHHNHIISKGGNIWLN